MLEKRYIVGLVLLISFLTLVSTASADHFAITYVSPINFTTATPVSPDVNITLNIQFNLTNTSLRELNESNLGDYYNLSNISIVAIMPNGTEVDLLMGAKNASAEAADPSPYGYDANKHNYYFDIPVNINTRVIPVDQEGDIRFNITAEVHNYSAAADDFNESITFLGLSFNWDASAPGIKIKFLDRNNNEKTTFSATDKVKIVCTRTAAGASYNDTNISIQTPLTSSFETLGSETTRDTVENDFIVEFTQTRELGDYTVACYSIDDLGSINDTVNTTFSIVKKIPNSASPFVNPNFKPPVATILVGTGSVSSLGTLTEEGASRLIAKEGAVSLIFGETTYTLTLTAFTDTSATYTITGGTAFDVVVNAQETKTVDITGDGADDISITLHQVYNKKADTSFKLISVQQGQQQSSEEQQEETKEPTSSSSASSISGGWGIIVFIFLIVLFILGALHYISARKRSGGGNSPGQNNSSLRFTARDMGMQRPPNEPQTLTRH